MDYFGKELLKAGYNYYGTESMYSGTTGQVFEADVYIGVSDTVIQLTIKNISVLLFPKVVYYQRLRHMVSDKYQVRSTGPVHNLTHQPIKVSLGSFFSFSRLF